MGLYHPVFIPSWLGSSLQPLWLPKSVHKLKVHLGTLDSVTCVNLLGVTSLSSLCELDIRGATIRSAALVHCLFLTSLSLHRVWLETNLPMPESLQSLSIPHSRVNAPFLAFPPLNGADSFSFCLHLTSAKEFRELEMHESDRDIAVLLPACVKKVGITCATLDYGYPSRKSFHRAYRSGGCPYRSMQHWPDASYRRPIPGRKPAADYHISTKTLLGMAMGQHLLPTG